MLKNVQIKDGEFGRRAVLTSEWSQEIAEYLTVNEVAELELNQGKGWSGSDLSFLRLFPHLKALDILDFQISSVESIHLLHELRELKVITYCKTEIDFSAFPQLQACSLEWRPKASSLFDCVSLRKLVLNRFTGKDTNMFARLARLESLAIFTAPVRNLHGLSGIKFLKYLRLANLRRLESLSGLEQLVNLEELDINTCRSIRSVDVLGNLNRLKKLYLNNVGEIESLKPLEKLDALEEVLFYESTNILDGDLWPLTRLKHLSKITFQNRRHYSHRREDFGATYSRSATCLPKINS